ncbi:hypothetical protein MMYC01_200862 [Madurella mycetomatis]|uniref:F-box domain-containing protein n=1 Tax=Madurella mycetomatis TaxID=100816 RepID=A0A175WGP9_9PEZI|nr:hypothetical protein MMYC01_200862 [Madurella mycetomatis]
MKSLLPIRRKSPHGKQRAPPSQDYVIQPQDCLSHLPVELLLVIFEHFTLPAHVLSALNVCRSWRAILLSPEIWTSFAERFAPGLVDHIRASSPSAEAQGEAFHDFALRQHHRCSGYFRLATHHMLRLNLDDDSFFTLSKQPPVASGGVHSLDSVRGLDPSAEDEHASRLKLYSHGRVAWWPEGWHIPSFAIVDDLRTRTRRMYLFPLNRTRRMSLPGGQWDVDRQRGWKTAMGEFLFVMGQEDAGVCVWHLERDEMRQLKLPGAFDRCVVQGGRLLFVGRRAAEVWTWTWDANSIQIIDTSEQGCYLPGPVTMGGQILLGYPPNPRPSPKVGLRFRDTDVKLDFILHPTNPDVLLVVTYDEVDLVVYELTSGQLTASISLPRSHLAYRVLQRSRSDDTVHYLRHERCDAHGGYCLVTAWLGPEQFCDGACACPGSLGSVCFNVYTKRFTAFVHHALYQRTPETHLWDGQLAVMVNGRRDAEDDAGTSAALESNMRPLVALLKPCDGLPNSEAPLISGSPLPLRSMRRPSNRTGTRAMAEGCVRFVPSNNEGELRHRPQRLDRVAYVLAAGGGGRRGPVDPHESVVDMDPLKAEWLNGDDKTLIYVAGKEYTIWRFGEDCDPNNDEKTVARAWRERWRSVVAGAGRGAKA